MQRFSGLPCKHRLRWFCPLACANLRPFMYMALPWIALDALVLRLVTRPPCLDALDCLDTCLPPCTSPWMPIAGQRPLDSPRPHDPALDNALLPGFAWTMPLP